MSKDIDPIWDYDPEKAKSDSKLIFKQMALVLRDVDIVQKKKPEKKANSKDKYVSYPTQKVGELINAVHESMRKHAVFMTKKLIEQSEVENYSSTKGTLGFMIIQRWRFTFHTVDGSPISTESSGVGYDYSDKYINKAMQYALKYAILQTFLIPSDDPKDNPDILSPDPVNYNENKNKKINYQKQQKIQIPKKPEISISEYKEEGQYLFDEICLSYPILQNIDFIKDIFRPYFINFEKVENTTMQDYRTFIKSQIMNKINKLREKRKKEIESKKEQQNSIEKSKSFKSEVKQKNNNSLEDLDDDDLDFMEINKEEEKPKKLTKEKVLELQEQYDKANYPNMTFDEYLQLYIENELNDDKKEDKK